MRDAADYLTGLAQERKQRPTDDLLTALVEPDEHGSKMTDSELVATCVLLLTAGHETTTNLISNSIVALTDNPAQRAALQTDPGLIVSAVEEFLRYEAPTQMTGRIVAEDFEFDGVHLRAGEKALLLIGSANHDEQVFDNPDSLDITRKPNNHVGFGYGIHFCTGSALARLEGQVAIPTILRRYPKLRVAGDGPTRAHLSLVRGISELPVEV
jgi:pimeloyl-[acyl-carrier protein] synthase